MIYLTTAPNDADLIPIFGDICDPIPIPYGDFNFEGKWWENEPIWVWGERKKIGDMVTCIQSSGRLLRQVQDAKEAGFSQFFIIFEAIFRCSPINGAIQTRRGKNWVDYHINPTNPDSLVVPYKRVVDFLNQLDYYCGIRYRITAGPRDTVRKVLDLYQMFQTAPEDHGSLKQFETTADPGGAAFLTKPGLVRRVAKELDKVGWDRSKGFELEFENLADMCRVIGEGDVKRLQKVQGVGKGIAQSILDEAHNQRWE